MKKQRFAVFIKAAMLKALTILLLAGVLSTFYFQARASVQSGLAARARVQVTGTVTSASGEPLPGVSVKIRGSASGASTDINGRFSLNVPDLNAVLVFSYIGFTTKEVPLNGQATITVQLAEEATALNEVVVIGYQAVRKRDLTGAASVINTAQAGRVATNSVAESIQGLSPGVTVRNTGVPGENASIQIRG
ncbi:carboxypeptidase-like regulatory domain-containing protein [Arcticibacter sp. MXS-1]|uniref:carboxypeptidase-like regulatory domain-containing protein n=1 Tax=Arcticibacter sp. MXS-1 TaxID=3341726 RepID=UPI0035A8750A